MESSRMPLYMDVHRNMHGATMDDLKKAHAKDLEIQDAHEVNYMRYWLDPKEGNVFCLVEAPDKEAAIRVHKEAGHPADDIFEVQEGS